MIFEHKHGKAYYGSSGLITHNMIESALPKNKKININRKIIVGKAKTTNKFILGNNKLGILFSYGETALYSGTFFNGCYSGPKGYILGRFNPTTKCGSLYYKSKTINIAVLYKINLVKGTIMFKDTQQLDYLVNMNHPVDFFKNPFNHKIHKYLQDSPYHFYGKNTWIASKQHVWVRDNKEGWIYVGSMKSEKAHKLLSDPKYAII
ncbi:hypothetical protein D3C78_20170 [compost metagenome]